MKKNWVYLTLPVIFFFLTVFVSKLAAKEAGKVVLAQESEGMSFQVEEMASGLGIPWAMAFLNPYEMIFTQRDGPISIFSPNAGKITRLKGGPARIKHGGQGGMLDVALPPNYAPGGWIYFTYSREENGKGVTTLARARRENNRLKDWQDLLVTLSATKKTIHYGSRIAFDDAGHIYFTVGDRGVRPNAQNLSNHAGTVLRVNMDASVPKDNPFVSIKDSLPEIFSFGHRNPQGIVYDFSNKRLWAIEHGPRGGDEINLILPGRNYGWPVISYGKEYWGPIQVGEGKAKKGMEQPKKYYDPSIAPGSLLLYTGNAFPKWKGNLMAGALKLQHLNRLAVDPAGNIISEERLLKALNARIRAMAQSPEGWIYLSADSGYIYRIKPAVRNKQ